MHWETNEELRLSDEDLTPLANLLPLGEISLSNLRDDAWAAAETAVKVVLQRGTLCRCLMPKDGEPIYECATGKPISPGLAGSR